MTNAELIKALRCEKDCDDCAYHTDNAWSRCDEWGMRCDAADALEAADKKIAELIPKEGEWIWENYHWQCSVCGENPTRGMGYVQEKNKLFRVCPNCGAKMQTVTDCHTSGEGKHDE